MNSFWLASYYGHGQVMKLLAEKGIDIFNTYYKNGNTVLHTAILKNYLNITKMLLNSRFPLEIPNEDELTPLCLAATSKE